MTGNIFNLSGLKNSIASLEIKDIQNGMFTDIFKRLYGDCDEEIICLNGNKLIVNTGKLPKFFVPSGNRAIIIQEYHENQKVSLPFVVGSDNHCESSGSTSTPLKTPLLAVIKNDLDVTGSPLKCPFSFDPGSPISSCVSSIKVSKKEKRALSYSGFTISKARKIAAYVRGSIAECVREEIFVEPVWIACDGEDLQKTRFLVIDPDEERRSLKIVTSAGPYLKTSDLPSLHHLTTSVCSSDTLCDFELTARGLYHILSNDDVDGSSLHVECEWKRPLAILSRPSVDAKTQAIVHLDVSDPRSVAHCLYTELKILSTFMGVIESGEIVWCVDDSEIPVRDTLLEYFHTFAIKEGASAIFHSEDDLVSNFDKIIEEKFVQVRTKLDFTDKLWSILIKSQSHCELKCGLSLVFESISAGYLKPQILVGNNTKVGNICRDLMKGVCSEPDLSGIVAVEMLIEMGLEKIKKDYVNVFEVGGLATGELLIPFVNWNSLKDPFERCLEHLKKLHAALQIITLIRQYLRFPQTPLILCTDKVLNELSESEGIVENFVFQIQTSLIQGIFESLSPHVWKVNIESLEPFGNSLDFIVTKENFNSSNKDFPSYNSGEDLDTSANDEEIATSSYYSTAIKTLPDIFAQKI